MFYENLNSYYKSIGGTTIKTPESFNTNNRSSMRPVSIGEVKSMIKQLDITKSTSTEDFPTWVTKLTVENICIPIADIIIACSQLLPTLRNGNEHK